MCEHVVPVLHTVFLLAVYAGYLTVVVGLAREGINPLLALLWPLATVVTILIGTARWTSRQAKIFTKRA